MFSNDIVNMKVCSDSYLSLEKVIMRLTLFFPLSCLVYSFFVATQHLRLLFLIVFSYFAHKQQLYGGFFQEL